MGKVQKSTIISLFALCIAISSLQGKAFAADQKADISQVGLDMFTQAYNWETTNAKGYTTDALKGFTDKLNKAIISDSRLKKLVGKGYCEGCSEVIKKGFDAELGKYLALNAEEAGKRSYIDILSPYIDPRARKMDVETAQALDDMVNMMLGSIRGQVTEQMDAFRDISTNGQYFDGDAKNSPYDLVDDMKRIDEIFLREAGDTGGYKNTASEDGASLITIKATKGEWAGGKDYDLNLLGDITNALGGKKVSGGSTGSGNEVAGNCDSGYCITVDIISSTHYLVGGGGTTSRGQSSFQGIFEEGLAWVTKNGDKRNLACKAPPGINFYESQDDMGLKFKKIFNGLGIYVLWKTPPFLKGYFSKGNTPKTTDKTAKSEKEKEKKATEGRIQENFQRLGINAERPSDLQATKEQAYIDYAVDVSTRNSNVDNVADAVALAKKQYENSKIAKGGSGTSAALLNSTDVKSTEHLKTNFEANVSAPVRAVSEFTRSMNAALTSVNNKPDCGN